MVLGLSGFLGIWAVFLSLFGLLTLKSVLPDFVLILEKIIHSVSVGLKISGKFLPC